MIAFQTTDVTSFKENRLPSRQQPGSHNLFNSSFSIQGIHEDVKKTRKLENLLQGTKKLVK